MNTCYNLFVVVMRIVDGVGSRPRKVKVAVAAITIEDALRQAREMAIKDQNVDCIVSVMDMEMEADLRFQKQS